MKESTTYLGSIMLVHCSVRFLLRRDRNDSYKMFSDELSDVGSVSLTIIMQDLAQSIPSSLREERHNTKVS